MEYYVLNNGIRIPTIGFGVYQIPLKETKDCVLKALKIGYRHIDTARNYGNEKAVGEALQNTNIPRTDIFLTTKIYGGSSYETACQYIEEALHNLKTDYIDLMLFHWPSGNIIETYRAMEDYYKKGKLKAIGLSNFYGYQFQEIIQNCIIKPVVNQIEAHVFMQQTHLQDEMKQYDISLAAWSPLACGRNDIFHNEVLEKIARKHHKSIAQIALRFLNQQGIVVVPKSTHLERMKENLNIHNFELTKEELEEIKALDTKQSLFGWY